MGKLDYHSLRRRLQPWILHYSLSIVLHYIVYNICFPYSDKYYAKLGIFLCGGISFVFQLICALSKPDFMAQKPKDNEGFEIAKKNGLRVCETCNIVRPERSSHCKACDRCVLRFDHHCPWVDNCISGSNHKYFVGFVTFLLLNLVLGMVVGYDGIQAHKDTPYYPWLWVAFFAAALTSFPVAALVFTHSFKVNRNVTTNEMVNCRRFPEGHPRRYPWVNMIPVYRNKYDLGLFRNWLDFLEGWKRSMPTVYQTASGQIV